MNRRIVPSLGSVPAESLFNERPVLVCQLLASVLVVTRIRRLAGLQLGMGCGGSVHVPYRRHSNTLWNDRMELESDGSYLAAHEAASRPRLRGWAADLPNGAMIFQDGAPHLVLNGPARRWSLRGYGTPTAPLGGALLITPPSTVTVLRAGYQSQLHASALSGSNPDRAG
jgi:hypothetical protein